MPLHVLRDVQNQERLCGISGFLHNLHCAHPSLQHNWMLKQSVEELNLRHLHFLEREGLQEQELHEHRDVHNRSPEAYRLSLTQYLYTALGRRWPPNHKGRDGALPANVHAFSLKHVPAPKYLHKRMGRNTAPAHTASVSSEPLLPPQTQTKKENLEDLHQLPLNSVSGDRFEDLHTLLSSVVGEGFEELHQTILMMFFTTKRC